MNNLHDKYKYNSFLEYSDQLDEIISEKQYDEDIASMLRLAFPVMIEYYGHEYKDILFNTLRKLNIDIPNQNENIHDIVIKHTPPNIEMRSATSLVSDGDLKRASGVHSSFPIFAEQNGQIALTGRYDLVSILRTSNKLLNIVSLIHELSHAFKSGQNGMSLIQNENGDNILITRIGISLVYSKVYIENGKIIIEDIKEKNLGLDEGINTYDENNIINRILSLSMDEIPDSCKDLQKSLALINGQKPYSSSRYVQETACAEVLLSKCRFERFIRQDQFMGTNNCEQKYDSIVSNPQNTWEILNSKIDTSVKHTYEKFEHIFDPQWYEDHKDEIINNLQSIYALLNECAKKRNRN